jgi:hemoglobin/transferrin/lactoferrin receptor protein
MPSVIIGAGLVCEFTQLACFFTRFLLRSCEKNKVKLYENNMLLFWHESCSLAAVFRTFTEEFHMLKLSPLALAVFTALMPLAYAADKPITTASPAATPLDDVTVIATRTERSLNKVPASVSVVKQKDFAQQQANSVADVMKKLPNVDFGGGPRFEGQLPTIRGYQGPAITLLVDGARSNSPSAAALWSPLYLDPYYLKQAEVVRGLSSSLYGAGGNGGVMSFTTLNAKDLLEEGRKAGADAKAGYASGDNSHRYNARVYGQNEQADLLLGLGYRDFDEIRQGEDAGTMQLNSGHSNSGILKLGVEPNDRVRFELSGQTFQSQNRRANNPQIVSTTQTQLNHTQQDNLVLRASTKNKDGAKALDARIYQNKLRVVNDRNPSIPALAATDTKTDTTGGSIQNTSRLQEGKHTLTYGVDTYKDKLVSRSNGAVSTVNPDGTADVLGVFLQDEIALTDKWSVTPSIRHDKFDSSPATASALTPATKFSHTSPKLAVAYQATPNLNLYGNYGQAFRAPTVWELYQSTQNSNGTFPTNNLFNFKSNPSLKPQTDTTLEIGAKYKKENVFSGSDKLQLRAAVFKTNAKDMVNQATVGTYVRTPPFPGTGSIFQYQNVDQAKRDGIELEGNYERGALRLDVGASKLRVKDKVNGNNLFSPPDKLTTKVSYQLPKNTSVSWAATGVAAQDYDSTVLRRRSGYATHDVHVGWKPNRKVEVDFGVNNVFDKKYLSYQSSNAAASTAYEMGRNYMISVSGGF